MKDDDLTRVLEDSLYRPRGAPPLSEVRRRSRKNHSTAVAFQAIVPAVALVVAGGTVVLQTPAPERAPIIDQAPMGQHTKDFQADDDRDALLGDTIHNSRTSRTYVRLLDEIEKEFHDLGFQRSSTYDSVGTHSVVMEPGRRLSAELASQGLPATAPGGMPVFITIGGVEYDYLERNTPSVDTDWNLDVPDDVRLYIDQRQPGVIIDIVSNGYLITLALETVQTEHLADILLSPILKLVSECCDPIN